MLSLGGYYMTMPSYSLGFYILNKQKIDLIFQRWFPNQWNEIKQQKRKGSKKLGGIPDWQPTTTLYDV